MESQPSVQADLQSLSLQSQPWLRQYEAVIRETDQRFLWTRIEAAEPVLRTRLDAIRDLDEYAIECEALTEALAVLDLLKSNRLGFHKHPRTKAL